MILHRIKHGWPINCLVASLILMAAIVVICSRSPGSWESGIFKKYVLKPIPKTVSDIKVDKLSPGGLFGSGRMYVIHFKISKADTASILNSRAFEEFEWVAYRQRTNWGVLEWGNKGARVLDARQNLYGGIKIHSIIVYTRQEPPSDWFKPDDWNSPEVKVYSFREKWGRSRRYRTNVFIFNEDLGEAYFFENVPGH